MYKYPNRAGAVADQANLKAAVDSNNAHEVTLLLRGTGGRSVPDPDADMSVGAAGEFALVTAAASGNLKIVEELLKANANPNVLDQSTGTPRTALGIAYYHAQTHDRSRHCYEQICKTLLNHKDINPTIGMIIPVANQEDNNRSLKDALHKAQELFRTTGSAHEARGCALQ